MIIISIFRLEVIQMGKTVHNNTQKTLFWNRADSEPSSVDTLFVKWGREVQRGERRCG